MNETNKREVIERAITDTTMKKKLQEKGVVLFAFNNESIDYVKMAVLCAKRVTEHWGLPVCLITDKRSSSKLVDKSAFSHVLEVTAPPKDGSSQKFYYDYNENLSFLNQNRCNALDYTPFEKTILIDVDLMINTTNILDAWHGRDVAVPRAAHSALGSRELPSDMSRVSVENDMSMYWATVVCFDASSAKTLRFFKAWKQAVKSYDIYASIFKFNPFPVRNDYAVTIAIERTLGINSSTAMTLPYSIPTLMLEHELVSVDPLLVQNPITKRYTSFTSDLHVMNKKSIFKCLINRVS